MISFDKGQFDMVCLPRSVAEALLGTPSACLKLYLYMLLRDASELAQMSEELGMSAEEVEDAYSLLIEKGLVAKSGADRVIMQAMYEAPAAEEAIYGAADDANTIQLLFSDRILTSKEHTAIRECMTVFGLPWEVVVRMVEHCIITSRAKNRVSMHTIQKKAAEWSESGINTLELAEKRAAMETTDSQNIKELLIRLGMRQRSATEEEKKVFYKWTHDYGMDMAAICAGLPATLSAHSPSVKYLDSILTDMHLKGCNTAERISAMLNDTGRMDADIKELLESIGAPRHTVTADMRRMYTRFMNMGLSKEVILLAARMATREGFATLDNVNMILSGWCSRGFTKYDDIVKMLDANKLSELRAQELVNTLGLARKATHKDIALINRFMEKGMSEEAIMYAAQISKDATNPEKYMAAVLKNWADDGITDAEAARKQHEARAAKTAKKGDYERSYTEEELSSSLRDPLSEL